VVSLTAVLAAAAGYVWAAPPWAATRFFEELGPKKAYTALLPPMFSQDLVSLAAAIGLCAFIPLAALAVALWPRKPAASPGRWRTVGWAAGAAAIVAAQVVLALGTLDGQERSGLWLDYAAEHGWWDAVLAEARAAKDLDSYAQWTVVRALYFKGRLLDEMFAYPQSRALCPAPPALERFYDRTQYGRPSQRCLELGRVNAAEHLAYEALETQGEQPATLARLASISVLKGHPAAAQTYLRVLEKCPGHRDWAREHRRRIDADPLLASDPAVAAIRERMLTQDLVETSDLEQACRQLLEANPRNRMAVEYLTAHYLLAGRTDKVDPAVRPRGTPAPAPPEDQQPAYPR
jgi:tetratricopeptide (TPR) repeat protein